MAVNFHKDLPNSQIHNPKDFSTANINSVCTKDENNLLKWAKANYTTSTTIKCTADVSKQLAGTYFYLYTSNDAVKYQVWFDVTNDPGTVSADSGCTLAEVDILENDTANTVATRLQHILNALAGVTATVSTDTVTVTGITSATDITDVNTNFTFTATRTQVANEYLTTNSSGNIEWIVKPTIPTVPNQYHYLSAIITPRNSSQVNVYMTSSSSIGLGSHSGVTLNTTTSSASLPTTTLASGVTKQNFFFMPTNVTAFKIHYSVWHTDVGTQSVDFQFFDARFDTGTGTVSLNNIASITDSVPAGEQVNNIATCSSAGSGARGLLLYGKAPTQRNYYIAATVELTVT